jgi:hypothetical protein
MKAALVISLAVLSTAACGRSVGSVVPAGSPSSATASPAERDAGRGNGEKARGPRALKGVPPGHYPKEGECRLWYEGRPPGQQPKAASCSSLMGRVPDGAFILYGGRAWDSRYDWATQARRERGSVPDIIVQIARSIR